MKKNVICSKCQKKCRMNVDATEVKDTILCDICAGIQRDVFGVAWTEEEIKKGHKYFPCRTTRRIRRVEKWIAQKNFRRLHYHGFMKRIEWCNVKKKTEAKDAETTVC